MVVKKLFRKETRRKEYALVSIKSGRPLKWFGTRRPTQEEVDKEEIRIQYFRNLREKK